MSHLNVPDDNDFSCTLIVAEIRISGDVVQWKRIGIDRTTGWDAEMVGTTVEWFDKLNGFEFDKQEYLTMIDVFRQRILFDESRSDKQNER